MKQKTTTKRLGEVCEDRTDWRRVDAETEEDLADAIRADRTARSSSPAGSSER